MPSGRLFAGTNPSGKRPIPGVGTILFPTRCSAQYVSRWRYTCGSEGVPAGRLRGYLRGV
eukprot:1183121-Prorocentrum_minimum.AAC.1